MTHNWSALRLRCGDVVREIDGRHEGVVLAIVSSVNVHVCWLDAGWRSELHSADLERVSS